MTIKSSAQVFASSELIDLIESIEPNHKFQKWIENMKNKLLDNIYTGDLIAKKKIPRYYKEKYGVNNLYRYQHPEGYRSCYTLIRREGIGVCPHILDLMTHREYDRRFGYRKR